MFRYFNLCSDFVKFHHEINILKNILYKKRDLPYLGKLSLQIRTRINRVIKNKLPNCNFRIVFQTKCKFIIFFIFKDKIPVFLRSGIVYKFICGGCNATYNGKTKRHFKVRMCEHLAVSSRTGKRAKGDNDFVIKEHHGV